MRGIVRTGRKRVEVVDVPRPVLEPGTAVVRVLASGICGSDLHPYRESDSSETRPAGHEVAGEVVAIASEAGAGDGASDGMGRVRVGDLVAIDTICLGRACFACEWCRQGAYVHCQNKRGGKDRPGPEGEWSGAYAEFIKRDVRGLFPLPPQMSAAEGALVEPLAVAVHALRSAPSRPGAASEGSLEGQTVAIVGAGTIGLTTTMAAVAMGADRVFTVAKHPHQAEAVRALGAEAVSPDGAVDAVKEVTGGLGADLVVETVGGATAAFDQAVKLLRRRGRLAVLGLFSPPTPVDLMAPLMREAIVYFPNCYSAQNGKHDYEVTIDLIASGKAPARSLLTHTFSLEQAPKAFSSADSKDSGSIKVQFAL